MTNETYTEDFSDIMQCARERREVMQILNAWDSTGLPKGFYEDDVKFAFNRSSGHVFLVNSDYQCAMMNGDTLALFHSTPYEGIEGFIEDILTENAPDCLNSDDVEYILRAAGDEGAELPEVWQAVEDAQ